MYNLDMHMHSNIRFQGQLWSYVLSLLFFFNLYYESRHELWDHLATEMGSDTQKCIGKSDTDTQFLRKKIEYSDTILKGKVFFTDEAIEKTEKSFPAPMKR